MRVRENFVTNDWPAGSRGNGNHFHFRVVVCELLRTTEPVEPVAPSLRNVIFLTSV